MSFSSLADESVSLGELAARSNVTTASRIPVKKCDPGYRFARREHPSFPVRGSQRQREKERERKRERLLGAMKILAIFHGFTTHVCTRVSTIGANNTRVCIHTSAYVCMCVRARVCMNFSRSQHAHTRGHGRHTSALGETLRPDPRSFLSPRFSVPRHPRVAQARTAFRISEGRATRTREGATARERYRRGGSTGG